MSVSLSKGGSLSLTKAATEAGAKLENLVAGGGWDGAEGKKIDLDLYTVYLGEDGKAIPDENGNGTNADEAVCAFFTKDTPPKGTKHSGDNRDGAGEGDDEQITLTLADVPANVKEIAVVIASYSGEKFGEVKNAFVRLVNADGNTELAKYDLTDKYADALTVEMGRIVRTGDGWDFKATGVEIPGDFKAGVESFGVTGITA